MTSKRAASSNEMVLSKNRNKVLCSTPEHRTESPSRESDTLYDSDTASPVPFLCTQDGTEGETDVIWNHYTPKSGTKRMHTKNTTPLSRRSRKTLRPKILEKPLTKRRTVKTSQKKNELLQELLELNQNLQELVNCKTEKIASKEREEIEDIEIFNDSQEFSPKGGVKSNTCLRKNLLSSKFTKPDLESGLESDDSMNECMLKVSQMVEEKIFKPDESKRPKSDICNSKCLNSTINLKMDHDSMDAILNSIKLDSPCAKRFKKCHSPQLNNDSFDGFVGNLNDTALERLTQMPTKTITPVRLAESKTEKSKELSSDCHSPLAKSIFSRHSSMPESPSLTNLNRPSSSGMVFGRYSSMPIDKNEKTDPGDSPIRCTPEEIKKKHQLARERLLAKRQLPFTTSQPPNLLPPLPEETATSKKVIFQPKVASAKAFNADNNNAMKPISDNQQESNAGINNKIDLKSVIEKKRQEALMKLRLRKKVNTKT